MPAGQVTSIPICVAQSRFFSSCCIRHWWNQYQKIYPARQLPSPRQYASQLGGYHEIYGNFCKTNWPELYSAAEQPISHAIPLDAICNNIHQIQYLCWWLLIPFRRHSYDRWRWEIVSYDRWRWEIVVPSINHRYHSDRSTQHSYDRQRSEIVVRTINHQYHSDGSTKNNNQPLIPLRWEHQKSHATMPTNLWQVRAAVKLSDQSATDSYHFGWSN